MIQHKVYRLKKQETTPIGAVWPAAFEFEIVRDVICIQGSMLPPQIQTIMLNWVLKNPNLFIDDTRY